MTYGKILMAFIVRSYSEGDEVSILKLFHTVFETERSRQDWEAKFLNNYTKSTLIELAFDQQNLAGQYTLLPITIRTGQGLVNGAQSLDTMTHPDYRGQGIFTLLAQSLFERCKAENVSLLYGFPNENSYPGFVKKLGWKHIGDVSSFARPLKSKYFFEKKFPSLVKILETFRIFRLIDSILSIVFPFRLSAKEQASIRNITSFDSSYDDFYSKVRPQLNKFHVERDGKYMNWRYFTFESARNQVFGYYDQQGFLKGVLVLTVDSNRAAITEVMAQGAKIESSLLKHAIIEARKSGVSTLAVWCNEGVSLFTQLRKHGFFKWTSFKFIVKDLSNQHPESENLSNWYLSAGDSDVF